MMISRLLQVYDEKGEIFSILFSLLLATTINFIFSAHVAAINLAIVCANNTLFVVYLYEQQQQQQQHLNQPENGRGKEFLSSSLTD